MAIGITLTQEQYDAGISKLETTPGCTITGNHIQTPWIDADFEYDPAASTLKFTNEKKHGLTNFVSDGTIAQHLIDLLKEN